MTTVAVAIMAANLAYIRIGVSSVKNDGSFCMVTSLGEGSDRSEQEQANGLQ